MDKKSVKILILMIALLMALTFTACGGKSGKAKDKDSGQTTEQNTTDDATAQSEDFPKVMYVTAEDGLILRKEPGTDQEAILTLEYGYAVQVDKIENGWAYTVVDSHAGWCSTKYLTEDKSEIKPKKTASGDDPDKLVEPETITDNGYKGKIDSPEGVNLRYGPGQDYGIITVIPDGAEVTEKGWNDEWAFIEYDGKKGWIKYEFFKTGGNEAA